MLFLYSFYILFIFFFDYFLQGGPFRVPELQCVGLPLPVPLIFFVFHVCRGERGRIGLEGREDRIAERVQRIAERGEIFL